MRLPEWCSKHTFLEFLQLIEDKEMNEEITNETANITPEQINKLMEELAAAPVEAKPEAEVEATEPSAA